MEKHTNTHHPSRVVQKNPVAGGGEQHPFEKKTGEPEPEPEPEPELPYPENHYAKSIQLIKHVPILAVLTPTSSDSSSPVALLGAATEHG